jgi:SAM-dependent methyltransferase
MQHYLKGNVRARLKSAVPNLYSYLAAARKSSQLFGTIRGRQFDIEMLRDVIQKGQGTSAKTCPLCGYKGFFSAFGSPPRWDAQCPSCGSLERHRLFALSLHDMPINGAVLHFAPEAAVAQLVKKRGVQYTSADISRRDVDKNWNIEKISCADDQYDVVICSHVLEHVNDRKALKELYRIIKPGGLLLVMVPIAEGCAETYEDENITDPKDREIHYGQDDHVRIYGADFKQRLFGAGFEVMVYTAFGRDSIKYGLLMGEKLWSCRKPM